MTNAAGMGPLPELLSQMVGPRAVRRAFAITELPLTLTRDRNRSMPLASLLRLFTVAANEAGDRCFGLRVGQLMNARDYGPWVDAALLAPTLAAALERAACDIKEHQNSAVLDVRRTDNDRVYWQYLSPLQKTPASQHSDHILPPMIGFLREYLGADWTPDHVCVPYGRDAAAHLLEQELGVSVRFDAPGTGVALKRSELASPRPSAVVPSTLQPAVYPVEGYASGDQRVAPAIREIVRLRLEAGLTDLEGTARLAGMSPRSVQRQLRNECLTYRQVVEQVLMQRARVLLRESNQSVAAIARTLGYNNPANFTRAFRRVTGYPPTDLRDREAGFGSVP